MHEEAMLADLRRKLIELGGRQGSGKIVRVSLWVGALSHVHGSQLQARWPELVSGTPAEGSALVVHASPNVRDPRAGGVVLTDVTFDDGGGDEPASLD